MNSITIILTTVVNETMDVPTYVPHFARTVYWVDGRTGGLVWNGASA